jgi:hypothetical protein
VVLISKTIAAKRYIILVNIFLILYISKRIKIYEKYLEGTYRAKQAYSWELNWSKKRLILRLLAWLLFKVR